MDVEKVPDEDLRGDDQKIIESPVLRSAFERILQDFKPSYSQALMALCTSTRPYSATLTWRALLATANGVADPVVTSNGGIIPIEYESEWPFTRYDAPGSAEHDALYVETLVDRLTRFIGRFGYERVAFVYLPGKRNRGAVRRVEQATGARCEVFPGPMLWRSLTMRVPSKSGRRWTERFKADGFLWHPLAHPEIQSEARRFLEGGR